MTLPGDWLGRCLALGFPAVRLSRIGVDCWSPIFDRCRKQPGMSDFALVEALVWCEEHPGRTWRPPAKVDPDALRETCKLVERIRGTPGEYVAAERLVEIGEALIARRIREGTAPADVAGLYEHLVAEPQPEEVA